MTYRKLFSFLLFNGALWSLAGIGYFRLNGFFTDAPGWLFTVTFLIGHIFSFAWLLGIVTLPFKWVGPRAWQAACVGGSSLFSLFLILDFIVFSQYRFHINRAMLELILGPARQDIFVFSTTTWLLAVAGVLGIIALEIGLIYAAKRTHLSNRVLVCLVAGWLVCFTAYNGLHVWGAFKRVPSVISQRKALPLAYPLSANRRLRKWGFTPADNPYAFTSKGSLHYPLTPLTCTPPAKPANLLLIVVDAWRADTFSAEVTPQLWAWAQQPGVTVFTQHLSGGNSTAGGIFSLFYGLPHSYWDDFTALGLPPLLVEKAFAAGYEPAIFASSKLNSPAFNRNVFATVPDLRLGSSGATPWERDEQAVADFEQFLSTRAADKPFFGFVFLDAPHGYSYPPQAARFTPAKEINYLLLTNKTDPLPYWNRYKNSVYFTDGLVVRVLSALQQHRLLDNTLVVITADHGQELNDSHRNFWGHNGNFTDYQTHVPLLVYDPARKTSARAEYRTSHYDLSPTLLHRLFACANPPADYSIGYDLFDPTPRPFTIFAGYEEKAIRLADTIFVFNHFDSFHQYGPHLEPRTQHPDPHVLNESFKTFSRFYK